jgi:hypothetical protein
MKRNKIIGHRIGVFEGEKREEEYKKPSDIGTTPLPKWLNDKKGNEISKNHKDGNHKGINHKDNKKIFDKLFEEVKNDR